MVLEDGVGLLEPDFLRPRPNLCRDEFFELEDSIRGTALYPLSFSHPVINHHFYQNRRIGVVSEFALANQIKNLHLLGHWEIGGS